MSTIEKDYGSGGAGLSGGKPGNGSRRSPHISQVLRDLADDLATIKTKVNAAIADRAAAKTPIDALIVDVADIRTKLTAAIADRASTKTQVDAAKTDIAALTTKFVALLTKLDANHGAAADHASTLTPSAATQATVAAPTATNPSAATATTTAAPTATVVGTLLTLKGTHGG